MPVYRPVRSGLTGLDRYRYRSRKNPTGYNSGVGVEEERYTPTPTPTHPRSAFQSIDLRNDAMHDCFLK